MIFLEGTTIRAHHKAVEAAKKDDTEVASGAWPLMWRLWHEGLVATDDMAGHCPSRCRPAKPISLCRL